MVIGRWYMYQKVRHNPEKRQRKRNDLGEITLILPQCRGAEYNLIRIRTLPVYFVNSNEDQNRTMTQKTILK